MSPTHLMRNSYTGAFLLAHLECPSEPKSDMQMPVPAAYISCRNRHFVIQPFPPDTGGSDPSPRDVYDGICMVFVTAAHQYQPRADQTDHAENARRPLHPSTGGCNGRYTCKPSAVWY